MVFGIIYSVKLFGFIIGIVGDCNFEWFQHRHNAGRSFIEVFAEAVFEQGDVDGGVEFIYADCFTEISYSGGREAASSEAGDGGHARVVPVGNVFGLDEFEEFAFAHDGVCKVQASEFDLLWVVYFKCIEKPVVEGAVVFEFEGAD